MNNNRSNRRRGRGNRNQGGSNQLNRIDSRARGNAPQLLDKYKKLAQDAQHNGDRVQAEYYLQFADHYLRVIADNKARQEEARAKRQEERGVSGDDAEDGDDGDNRRRGRRPRSRRDEKSADQQVEGGRGDEGESVEAQSSDETETEPKKRARKPKGEGRGDGRPARRKPREARNGKAGDEDQADEIDASVLPPAIGADESSQDDGGDNLEQVG
ncbi:MAG: DUF4167 domain-containing protein [Pseudomonadota bacterium]